MSTSHKNRFKTEWEIIHIIDQYGDEMLKLSLQAEGVDKIADGLRNTSNAYAIENLRLKSVNLRKRVAWRQKQRVVLGMRLSEIRTAPLPGVEIDGTVQGV